MLMQRTTHAVFSLCLLSSCLLSVATMEPARAEIVDRIVARVSDTVITQSDLMRTFPVYMQVVGVNPTQLRSAEGRQAVSQELLDFLISTQLLVDNAEERGISVTDAEVNEYIEQQQTRMGLNAAQFARELSNQGIELADFRQFIHGNMTRLRLTQLDVGARVGVTQDDVDRVLAERYPEGVSERYLSTSHIIVVPNGSGPEAIAEARARIEALEAELQSGVSFEEIAGRVNVDASRNTGGRLGSFRVDELDRDYTSAALSLDEGEISGPVQTQFGFHLIRLESTERREVTDLEGLRDRIFGELYQEAYLQEEEVYLRELREGSFVEILVESVSL